MTRCLLLLVFMVTPILSISQSNAEEELGSWYMFFGKHQVSEEVSINTGIQYRYYQIISNYNLNLFYTGINYHLDSNTYFTLNYGYLDIDRSIEFTDTKNTFEHRLLEQVFHKHKLWNIPFSHRLRLEHRFLQDVSGNSTQNRIRYRLTAKLPLYKTSYFTVNNEFFINLNGEVFRENRAYLAFGFTLSKTTILELGYMRQHINNLKLNRLQFGLYVNIDWRKKD